MKFVPGIYEHAAACIGRTPWEVSRNGDLLYEAHKTAWDVYRHPLIVVGIDIYNIEPEALGAIVSEPVGSGVPAITGHPFDAAEDLLQVPAANWIDKSRASLVIEAASRVQEACPEAEVVVPVCGPFALAMGLMGLENLLCDLAEDPEMVGKALSHLIDCQMLYLEALREAGLKPIVFESGTTPPFFSTSQFAEVEGPLLETYFSSCEALFGVRPRCVIGGNALPILAPLLEARPGGLICPSETDQAAFMQQLGSQPGLEVRLNFPSVLLSSGDRSVIGNAVEKVIRLGDDCSSAVIGCGVVPYETQQEVLLSVRDMVEQASA